jgi:plastocyanin
MALKLALRLSLTLLCAVAPQAHAAGDLTRQEPVVVTLKLGNEKGAHRFTPDALTLETGKLYTLRLENAGVQPYYFASPGLADAVYTRKVVAMDASGKVVAEIYGPIRRIEIAAGHTVEWWFLPVRTGVFDDVTSTKKLTEAGMRATIEVK